MPRYPHIPNVYHYTIDGNLYIVDQTPATESLLIIGPALDGPTDQPIPIRRIGEIENVFGPIAFNSTYIGPSGETKGYSGNDLVKAVRQAQSGGASNISVWRIGGSTASGVYTMPSVTGGPVTGTVNIYARFPGRFYNQVSVSFTSGATSGTLTVFQPTIKGGNVSITWSGGTSGQTLAEVFDRMNGHPNNTTVTLALGTIAGTALARGLHGSSPVLAGGRDGTIHDDLKDNRIAYYNQLTAVDTGHFALAEDYDFDVIYLAGIYFDDLVAAGSSTLSVAQVFADYLGRRTIDHPTLGVLGTRPLTDTVGDVRSKVQTHYNALITGANGTRTSTNWTNAGYFMTLGFSYNDSALEQPIDSGAYLQVVAADGIFNDTDIGSYMDTLAGVYAGTITSLDAWVSTTHTPVLGIVGLPYLFTKAQLNTLTGGVGRNDLQSFLGSSSYVTVRRDEGRGVLWTKGVTASQRKSDFSRLRILRIVNSVHKGVKRIAKDFLGKPNDLAYRQALKTSVKTFLDRFADSGGLLGREGVGYFLNILGADNPYAQHLGEVTIDLILKPAFEIELINIRVRVSQ
jgi:hypothetical protein